MFNKTELLLHLKSSESVTNSRRQIISKLTTETCRQIVETWILVYSDKEPISIDLLMISITTKYRMVHEIHLLSSSLRKKTGKYLITFFS